MSARDDYLILACVAADAQLFCWTEARAALDEIDRLRALSVAPPTTTPEYRVAGDSWYVRGVNEWIECDAPEMRDVEGDADALAWWRSQQ